MGEVIRFTPVERWAVDYLTPALAARPEPEAAGVYVNNTVPSPRRQRMVVVRGDGGTRLDVVRTFSRIGVQVWAETDYAAASLAELVKAVLDAGVGGDVHRVESTVPVRVADSSEQPLWYFTTEVILRGSAA